eukprot:CAMPEP_0184697340 /NCGR_PEP_ID=MMETSP0313-20130426/4330_1 /TAXON_ID=2792 /ORGANISM="Porphyridium aerugineum, Strain SAG 1380-2" /LENGTH=651 /DNA_ID=CAMNT_0027156119 /DNA_START=36 /DNA_END=1987 /DNA_ORIENTATION=-
MGYDVKKEKRDKDRKEKKHEDDSDDQNGHAHANGTNGYHYNEEGDHAARHHEHRDRDKKKHSNGFDPHGTVLDEEDKDVGKAEVDKTRLHVDNFDLSAPTKRALAEKNISVLFDIQAATFDSIMKGCDLIGRARTGSGKTLAFVLPCVETIVKNKLADTRRRGRSPLVIVLAPTRELANQVFRDFEHVAGAHGLRSVCLYGGTPFGPQCHVMREGVDIVVGTPGRVIDHLERETLRMESIKFVILDEADEMLSMGFQEDVEKVMDSATSAHQTLLFSATVPKWVKDLTSRYLKNSVKSIDTVGDDKNRTNADISHVAIPCPPNMRAETLGDLVKVHAGTYGKSLVFCDTKKDANELAEHPKLISLGSAVLHGDIPQATRESTLDKYRSGKIRCLIATDVAARGLDIQGVDLVVQTHPPINYETYIHRSGRTGRAGKKGVCVTFYSIKEKYAIKMIEHKTGIRFVRGGPPQPKDIVKTAAVDATKHMDNIHEENIDVFRQAAKDLIADRGAEEALAAALACMTGYTLHLKPRSLLSCFEGNIAVIIKTSRGFENSRHVYGILRRFFSPGFVGAARGIVLCKDPASAVFDIPSNFLKEVKHVQESLPEDIKVEILEELPELQEEEVDVREAEANLRDRRMQQRQKWGKGGNGG